MTHKEAMTSPRGENWDGLRDYAPVPECDGLLIDPNTSYSSDVYWEVFTCSKCFVIVFTVEGSRHWWNHEGTGSPERMARIAAMQ
jgi:hypothetical protein